MIHLFQPTKNSCGQTCVAMIAGVSAEDVIKVIGRGCTSHTDRKKALFHFGISFAEHITRYRGEKIPNYSICVLHLNKEKNTHCAVWYDGKFYDPYHGILDEHLPGIRVTSYLRIFLATG